MQKQKQLDNQPHDNQQKNKLQQKSSAINSGIFANIGAQSNFIEDVQELTISELIELYAYAEAIVETIRESLIILDSQLKVKSVNKSYLETFNTTTSRIIGKEFFKLDNGQWDVPELRHLIEEVLSKKKNFEDVMLEHEFPRIGKKIMLLNGRCIVLANFRTQLILVSVEDVTERTLVERRTERFISMASHELRTPLTSIKAFMQLLEKKLKNGMDKPTAEIMSRVIKQLNSLNELIQDLFDVRKIKEGQLPVKKRRQRLKPIIEEAVTTAQLMATSHDIKLEATDDVKVRVDKDRIIQLVTNLLNNAIKYSPDSDEIRVKIHVNKDNAVVSVQDFGPGIPKAKQEHIFDAYYMADRKMESHSLGLGLYICSEIIRLHGGKMWLKSRKGYGATFFFSLPIAKQN